MILMNDFKSDPEALLNRELKAVERVLRSGWFVLGNEVKEFESCWAQRCGTRHAVGVGNGMDAIEIGLRASGIGPGDEVITTPMTAFATVAAIMRAGATPVLADIEPDTALLSIESAARCVSPRVKAVLLVHLYGQVRGMDKWLSFCEDNGLLLFEDCAQAHLAAWRGRVAGNFGSFGAYSFYPTKNLGAIGDAGALVTNDGNLARRAGQLRNYGQSERYHHPELGLNSRLDELQAALLLERLQWLEKFTTRRREIAATYFREIRSPAVKLLAPALEPDNHVYHLFPVLCRQRDELSEHLLKGGVTNLSHYPVPIHEQPPCREARRDPRGLVNAENHARQCLSIPCHPMMPDEQLAEVVEVINAFR